MKRIFILSALFFTLNSVASVETEEKDPSPCAAGKEFVETVKFLKRFKGTPIPMSMTIHVAKDVGSGCKGSFTRFKKILFTLLRMRNNLSLSIKTARKHCKMSDRDVQEMIDFIMFAYLEDGMNISALESITLTNRLMRHGVHAVKSFIASYKFCADKSGLNLPKGECTDISMNMAALNIGEPEIFKNVNTYFIENMDFPKRKAVKITLEFLAAGLDSFHSFKTVYEYARSHLGLYFNLEEAKKLALQIASLNNQLEIKNKDIEKKMKKKRISKSARPAL